MNSELATNQTLFQEMLENLPDGVIVLDNQAIVYANNRFADIIAVPQSAKKTLLTKSLDHFIHPSYLQYFSEWLTKLNAGKNNNQSIELILINNNDIPLNIELTGSIFNHDEKHFGLILVSDITEKKRAETEMQHLTNHDPLSKEINNRFLHEYISRAITEAKQNRRHVAVIKLDLDHIKLIIDSYGHTISDVLLQAITQNLKKTVSPNDIILSLGSDKFIIIKKDISSLQILNEDMQTLLHTLSRPFIINTYELFTTATAGVSVYPENGNDSETLLKNAELAHYNAKQKGQNSYLFYSTSFASYNKDRTELLFDLRHALTNNEFFLLYQPIIDSDTKKILGLETLLRWKHKNGILIPVDFLALAEEAGLIITVGKWVIETVIKQNKEWQKAGFTCLPVSINLSMHQFHRESELIEFVKRTLEAYELFPHCLEFEMSENVTILDMASEILYGLSKLGCQLTIDDFGASSFSFKDLKDYKINNIKIDRTLISNLPNNKDYISIVKAILSLARELNLNVIAEGVETKEQMQFLNTLGCKKIQGYLVSKPLPIEEITPYLFGQKTFKI